MYSSRNILHTGYRRCIISSTQTFSRYNSCHRYLNKSVILIPTNSLRDQSTTEKYFHTSTFHQKKKKSDDDAVQVKLPRPISIITDMNLLDEIPLEDVRNFCFIAHVDHGKSSLASRVLELTGNLGLEQQWTGIQHANLSSMYETQNCDYSKSSSPTNSNGKEQIELLDTLSVEKERGITVKASAASMLYPHSSAKGPHGVLLLNMVDTPGHVDFGTEVIRTLSSVQGAVLLFDAAQGVQAQSLSVHEKAKNLPNIGIVIPALTKVDLPSARTLDITLSVSELFNFDPDEVMLTSARSRKGVADILEAVCCHVPPPEKLSDDDDKILRAKVVDSWFEPLRGVVCLVQILSGELKEASRVSIIDPSDNSSKKKTSRDHYSVQDIGFVLPHRIRTGKLSRGQMGYVIVGLRDPRQAQPGTVMVLHNELSKIADMSLPIPTTSSSSSQSVLYASVHPMEGEGFDELSDAVDRLALNDTGLEIHRTSGASSAEGGGPYLGPGLKGEYRRILSFVDLYCLQHFLLKTQSAQSGFSGKCK